MIWFQKIKEIVFYVVRAFFQSQFFVYLNTHARQNPRTFTSIVLVIFFVIIYSYFSVVRPPNQFPLNSIISIPEGATLEGVATSFEEMDVVRSSFWLRTIVILSGGERSISAGDYFFSRAQNVFTIARIIIEGESGLTPLKVTVPEGASLISMASIFSESLGKFNPQRFLELAHGKEGYLFPDTYYFLPNISEKKVIDVMEETFYKRIESLDGDIERSGHSLKEILIMASIIEREARTPESRRLISGILWKRIEIGMALQVDVTFDYINGKNTFELTTEDLDIDSPYNTYRYRGLPPGPIGSPGLDSIKAALQPTESNYLYFLADKNNGVHYSTTFDEHKRKKQTYLY